MGAVSQFKGFSRKLRGAAVLLAAVSSSCTARAQADPDLTLGGALRNLAGRAAVAFVGQVTAIERSGDVVLVHLRVDQTLLGPAQTECVLREWSGLWPVGEQRYTAGQRALFFLHAPSGSGFSSPVDDAEGVIPVLPQGASAVPLLDTRRLDARLERRAGDPLPALSASAILLTEAVAVVESFREPAWREPARLGLPAEVMPPPGASAAPVVQQASPQLPVGVASPRLTPSVPKPREPFPRTPHVPYLPEPYVGR